MIFKRRTGPGRPGGSHSQGLLDVVSPKIAFATAMVLVLTGGVSYLVQERGLRLRKSAPGRPAAPSNALPAPTAKRPSLGLTMPGDLGSTNAPRYLRADVMFEQQTKELFRDVQPFWKVDISARDGQCVLRSFLEVLPIQADEVTRKIAILYSQYRNNGPVFVKFFGPDPVREWFLVAEARADKGALTTASYYTGP